jgi:uncharacterized membrane protein YfcA
LVAAAGAIALAGVAKGVTGLGLPVVAVPILVALYGDLRLVLPVTVVATNLSDIAMIVRWRRDPRELGTLFPFMIAGLVGIVLGTNVLLLVRPAILSLALAAIIVSFVVIAWIGKMPVMGRREALRFGAGVGLLAGVAQGAAGASGPIVTSYLLSTKLPRATFLFAINLIFMILDATQLVSLWRLGLLHGTASLALGACGLTVVGMAAGFAVQHRIDDALFRRTILILLSLAAVGLILRAVH